MAHKGGVGVTHVRYSPLSTLPVSLFRATILLCFAITSVVSAGSASPPQKGSGRNKTFAPEMVPRPAAFLFPFQKPPTTVYRPIYTVTVTATPTNMMARPTVATPAVEGPAPVMAANSNAAKPAPQAAQAQQIMAEPPKKAVLGGLPTKNVDVPVTAVFLVLFVLGAFAHTSTYRANTKRGHKFLLSSLMFDFCVVRIVTCLFRIISAIRPLPGLILVANIFQNGGAVVISAVNLFFGQRLVRAMHPSFGWHPSFDVYSLALIWSCPFVTAMNAIAIIIVYFSDTNPTRAERTEIALKVGSCWNMMLVATPLLWILLSSATPGPQPESFGSGGIRQKATLLVSSAALMTVAAAVRLTISVTDEVPEYLVSKATLFTTQFMLEIMVVAAYALLRVDLLFHIPNGASRPGDYSINTKNAASRRKLWTPNEIEREISQIGARCEILKGSNDNKQGPIMAILYPASAEHAETDSDKLLQSSKEYEYGKFSPKEMPNEAHPTDRPWRASRTTFYMTKNPSHEDLSTAVSSPRYFV